MSEIERLQQAIAALEAQRAVLSDAVVEAGLAPMRERLAALQASAGVPLPTGEQRKQTTVLFVDVVGSTRLSQGLDPEEVIEIMAGALRRLSAPVTAHGGHVGRFMGDGFKAVFGFPTAHENDAEQAVRTGLAIQETARAYAAELEATRGLPGFAVRVGINTGLVATGGFSEGEDTVMGLTVNLAARMESAAPPGGVLISHYTYRHVRGIFDVEPREPVAAKGFPDPVPVYLVLRAKPRAFRLVPRSVEGIETCTIGREAELTALQDAFYAATVGATRLVVVVGEAGVGKSRLLYEFENWLGLRPERILYFKGRATPETTFSPYSLFRDLFRHRFDILESDTTAAVRAKFEAGMGEHLPAEQSHLVGHLVGFDFSAMPAVRNLLGKPGFASLARADLLGYFRRLTQDQATVISLEDLHWADNPSLDLVSRLGRELPNQRLLILGLARPSLYERRTEWDTGPILPPLVLPSTDQGTEGGGEEKQLRLDLLPLSSADTRILIGEILQKVGELPEYLCEMIARRAEGNPFYVEELIKMLIEDGVIVPGEEIWRVELARLQDLNVPPTLTRVLQARLDSLPAEEKELLQRAAVVGRLFWDATVAELHATGDRVLEVGPVLEMLQARELIFRRGHSAFAGAQEYTFKHALLRDVAYETVLRRLRRVYHRQVAAWLASHGGERLNEYAGLIAEHYERAGRKEQAATWLCRAGQLAYQTSAYAEAITAWERALPLLPKGDRTTRAQLLVQLGGAFEKTSSYQATRDCLQAGLTLARQSADLKTAADALSGLSRAAMQQGEFTESRRLGEEALALAQQAGDRASAALARRRLGALFYYLGDWAAAQQHTTASLALYQELGDREGIAACMNNLGLVLMHLGDYSAAQRYLADSLARDRELGDRWGAAVCLTNLGWLLHLQGDYRGAVRYARESLDIHQEIGRRDGAARSRFVLGVALADLGDTRLAWGHVSAALGEALALGAVPLALYTLTGIAQLQAGAGQFIRAAELLGLALSHPATDSEVIAAVEPVLGRLRAVLPADELTAALERGKTLDLRAVEQEALAEGSFGKCPPVSAPGGA